MTIQPQLPTLLEKTLLGFSENFWERHEKLVQKKLAEKIEENELAELIEMTRQIENANAQRLEAAYQLAVLGNRNLKDLMREMGILNDYQTFRKIASKSKATKKDVNFLVKQTKLNWEKAN